MMFDFEDQDSFSRCSSNIGFKRSSPSRNYGSPRCDIFGMDCGDDTPVRMQKLPEQRQQHQHQQQLQQLGLGLGLGLQFQQGEIEFQMRCGFCSKLGPRNTNEDRLVALADLVEAVSFARTGTASGLGCGSGLGSGSGSNSSTGRSARQSVTASIASSVGVIHGSMSNSEVEGRLDRQRQRRDRDRESEREREWGRDREKERERERERERNAFFAVYDGHCGAQAAIHLQETLHISIYNHPLYHSNLRTAITECCIATDRSFLAESRERKQYSGTTALGAIVRGSELVVFNIGDCHAVLSCNGVAVDMSVPHKPNRCVCVCVCVCAALRIPACVVSSLVPLSLSLSLSLSIYIHVYIYT
jgi:Ni/Co efflux regulator RcnB